MLIIFTGNRGGMGDLSLWFTSSFYKNLVKRKLLQIPRKIVHDSIISPYIISDAGFPLRSYMLTPFTGVDEIRKKRFNEILSGERVKVEQVIGQIKQRFRSLLLLSNDNPAIRGD